MAMGWEGPCLPFRTASMQRPQLRSIRLGVAEARRRVDQTYEGARGFVGHSGELMALHQLMSVLRVIAESLATRTGLLHVADTNNN